MKYKSTMRVKQLLILLWLLCLLTITGCASSYVGDYGGVTNEGIYITVNLYDDGRAVTNFFGIPVTGSYKVNWGTIELTASVLGYSQTIRGKISEEQIKFADVVLKKNYVYEDAPKAFLSIKEDETKPDKSIEGPTQVENQAEKTEKTAQEKYDEAEALFSIGHYEEAITLYDEIAEEMDVEEQRTYALECFDYCDTYFEWSFGYNGYGVSNGLQLDKYTGYGIEEISIPYGVCCLSSTTFKDDNKHIKKMSLPDTVREIPINSLKGCINLETINIPESLRVLALNGTGIKELIIPDTVEIIPDGAFRECYELSKVVFKGNPKIDMGYTGIQGGVGVFSRCYKLKTIELPNELEEITNKMFAECTALTEIHIPKSVSAIGWGAFSSCISLENISLPESICEIRTYAFEKCASLRKISIPENVSKLSQYLFSWCISLNEVNLPDSLECIENNVFEHCSNLRKLVIPKKTKTIDNLAFGYSNGCIEKEITLYVTKGTYGHRYAEEKGMECCFDGSFESANSGFQPGDIIHFGRYEQNGIADDGSEHISWLVLHEEDDRVLLISSFILDYRLVTESEYSWNKKSELLSWSEKDFLNTAFTEDEKKQIEKVVLMSKKELEQYMPTEVSRNTIDTMYALSKQAGYDIILGWMLSDLSEYGDKYFVDGWGIVQKHDYFEKYPSITAIRPVLWLKKP